MAEPVTIGDHMRRMADNQHAQRAAAHAVSVEIAEAKRAELDQAVRDAVIESQAGTWRTS